MLIGSRLILLRSIFLLDLVTIVIGTVSAVGAPQDALTIVIGFGVATGSDDNLAYWSGTRMLLIKVFWSP